MPLYLSLFAQALTILLSAITPIILLLLLTAILIAAVQAALQLEDMALSLLPRTLLVIFLVMTGAFGAFARFSQLAEAWIGHAAALVRQPWG